jgi:uncharacterized protein (DUF433 family)
MARHHRKKIGATRNPCPAILYCSVFGFRLLNPSYHYVMIVMIVVSLRTGAKSMSLVLEREAPPLQEDKTGAIRVGNSRVLLEIVIRAFQDGASPESIVHRYSTLSLSDVYNTIGYYLRHQEVVETYLNQREQLAESLQQRLSDVQLDLSLIRSRLLSQRQA